MGKVGPSNQALLVDKRVSEKTNLIRE